MYIIFDFLLPPLSPIFPGHPKRKPGRGQNPCRKRHSSEEPGTELQADVSADRCSCLTCPDSCDHTTSDKLYGGCSQVHGERYEVHELGKGQMYEYYIL